MSTTSDTMISINRVRELLRRERENVNEYGDEFESGLTYGRNDLIKEFLVVLDKEEIAKAKTRTSRTDDINEEHF